MQTITVEFPLAGTWVVGVSPADSVPSHYTYRYGMAYAYDFMKPEDMQPRIRQRIQGKLITSCQGWAETITSPMDADVILVSNTEDDRMKLSLVKDSMSALRAVIAGKTKKSLSKVFGNYIVLKNNNIYMLLAHLKKDSVRVSEGQKVMSGEPLAQVGHNGSSLFPHLHMHAMNHADPNQASAVNLKFNMLTKCDRSDWLYQSKHMPKRGTFVKATDREVHVLGAARETVKKFNPDDA